jgi:hypothetical protein
MPIKRLAKAEPPRNQINMQDEDEVKWWARHFGVSREDLEKIINKVGSSAATVRKELGK